MRLFCLMFQSKFDLFFFFFFFFCEIMMELQIKYILDSWLHSRLPTTIILSLDWMNFYNFLELQCFL